MSFPNLNQSASCQKANHREGSGFAVLDFVCPNIHHIHLPAAPAQFINKLIKIRIHVNEQSR